MATQSSLIEKIPFQSFRYQGKCPKCRRIIKGPSEKLAEKNLVDHIDKHTRDDEAKRKWVQEYTSRVEL